MVPDSIPLPGLEVIYLSLLLFIIFLPVPLCYPLCNNLKVKGGVTFYPHHWEYICQRLVPSVLGRGSLSLVPQDSRAQVAEHQPVPKRSSMLGLKRTQEPLREHEVQYKLQSFTQETDNQSFGQEVF